MAAGFTLHCIDLENNNRRERGKCKEPEWVLEYGIKVPPRWSMYTPLRLNGPDASSTSETNLHRLAMSRRYGTAVPHPVPVECSARDLQTRDLVGTQPHPIIAAERVITNPTFLNYPQQPCSPPEAVLPRRGRCCAPRLLAVSAHPTPTLSP